MEILMGHSENNLEFHLYVGYFYVFFDIAFGGPAVGPISFNPCEEEDFWTRVAQYQLDLQDMEEAG